MNAQTTPYVTGDAAFAVDHKGTIVSWNTAAEKLFGRSASSTLGRRCWSVLASRDLFGNRYCCEHCPLLEMAARGETVHATQVSAPTAEERRTALSMSTLVSSGMGSTRLLHIFRNAETDQVTHRSPRPTTFSWSEKQDAALTQRELEVLGLLAEGRSTKKIARSLDISHTTVRNHIQRTLGKLKAHNRLEAVANGRRLRLI